MKVSIAICLFLSLAYGVLAQDLITINMSPHYISGTNTMWKIVVSNHTATVPSGAPLNAYIRLVQIKDIYSDSPPRLADAGPGWWDNMTAESRGEDQYLLSFNCTDTNNYIPPGFLPYAEFYIYTTVPSTNCGYRTGECLGRALTSSNSMIPSVPGQSFVGPINMTPLSGIEGLSISNGIFELSITNTSAAWQHTIERNTQIDAPESWSPCHTFSTDTNRYVWTESPSNGVAFYRIKSEYK